VQTNEQLTNYLLWLTERGITIPVYSERSVRENLSSDHTTCTDCELSSYRKGGEAYSFGGAAPRLLFVGDGGSPIRSGEPGPLPSEELGLLRNIVKALKLADGDFHYSHYFKCPVGSQPPADEQAVACRRHFLQSLADLRPAGIVILGSHALNFVSGKKLNFNGLRGKVFSPELYGIPTVATFHLRDMLRFPENKSQVWADLNLLNDHIKNQDLK
jgi:uracil-DNA glycosylase family 4